MPDEVASVADAESFAVAMALDHARNLGISKLEIRTDSKLRPAEGAPAPYGIEVNFVAIDSPIDKGFETVSELAYQAHIEHIELQKVRSNRA